MESRISKYTDKLMNKFVSESAFPLNSLSIMIPISFVENCVDLNWDDIYIAFTNGYISKDDVIDFAIDTLEIAPDDERVINLACLSSDETSVYELTNYLLNKLIDKSSLIESKEKLLYIVLCFIFEKRELFEDPFEAVEVIYDDFNFPKSIESFVRYMTQEEHTHNIGTNEANFLIKNWKTYLDTQKIKYLKSKE